MTAEAMGQTDIKQVVLKDGDMQVSLLSFGATTQGWWYKDQPMILGYDDPQAYVAATNYMGAIVGRVANRIGAARFDLGNTRFELEANEGRNTVHGGRWGLSRQNWTLDQVSPTEAVFRHSSPHGAGGFPGLVHFTVKVTLAFPKLTYTITAQPDRPTPISIAQHNYYCLGGAKDILAHRLQLASDRYLDVDAQGIPTGTLAEAGQNGMSFSTPMAVGEAAQDIDNFYVFDRMDQANAPVATFAAPSGLRLSVWSDQPGAQVYSGAFLGDPFQKRAGLCIEPSGYPNAPNIASFPSILCAPERPYSQVLTLEISEGAA